MLPGIVPCGTVRCRRCPRDRVHEPLYEIKRENKWSFKSHGAIQRDKYPVRVRSGHRGLRSEMLEMQRLYWYL